MASRDHSLDRPIEQAALAEFLENGFEKASLRKIAAAAGVTVGAIYTRHKTKDSLFCALVQPLIQRVAGTFETIRGEYQSGGGPFQPEHMAAAMQMENQAILHLLFDDYDRAVLLLCRSGGSSMEHFLEGVIQAKVDETLTFFHGAGAPPLDEGVLRLLLMAQFQMYAQIISGGYQLETARQMMDAATVYHTGGWMALLRAADRKQED